MRFLLILLSIFPSLVFASAQTLEDRLRSESITELVDAVKRDGDAVRGAVLFHQSSVGCANCHVANDELDDVSLGPNLALLASRDSASDSHVIESILDPSAVIRPEYATIRLLLVDGRVVTGMRVTTEGKTGDSEQGDAEQDDSEQDDSEQDDVWLRFPQDRKTMRFEESQIEEMVIDKVSLMPSGVVNTLAGRQPFLDLAKYVFEIRDGGIERARELQPEASLIQLQVPPYEANVDHVALIDALDDNAFQRGEAIYGRLCANCHGTHDQPGSLPTAPRFAEGSLRGGSDPYAMYRTLTYGFGLMVPQTWMVPRQKYDVIHYIRQAYFKNHNPNQYQIVSAEYKKSLPTGTSLGPDPVESTPWSDMNYGPSMFNTIEVGKEGSNIASKGLAFRLDPGPGGISRGKRWLLFDHDTMRVAAAWQHDEATASRFIDWQGIHFDGRHQIHPRVTGDVIFRNPNGPGWANPHKNTLSFADDQRVIGRDGKRYGPLPSDWCKYHGLYDTGEQQVVSYRVGEMEVLELFRALQYSGPNSDGPDGDGAQQQSSETRRSDVAFLRTIHLGPTRRPQWVSVASDHSNDLVMTRHSSFVARLDGDNPILAGVAGVASEVSGCELQLDQQRLVVFIPPSSTARTLHIWTTSLADVSGDSKGPRDAEIIESLAKHTERLAREPTLKKLVSQPANRRWPEVLTTHVNIGQLDASGFAIDELVAPERNPWLARLRLSGHDFYDDGDRMAVCSWDGDVFEVSGLSGLDSGTENPTLSWRRIASGLFQPLGVKIVDGQIYLTCRDQIVRLRDLNSDGEIDFYECFNNDHQVTEHFHEFAMGLQSDAEGNFYYAKSARHALPAVVPQHGTLLKVAADGSQTEILAVGFRAANGVCLNPDGSFVVTDQEGHWNPKNRINWVRPGGYYGNMYGYHDVTDASDQAMQQPVCWITNAFDRSPAELLWTPKHVWGNLRNTLLNLSYGYGKVYTVPHEYVGEDDLHQGAMCALPLPSFPTGIMRGRFHPTDGQLYVCGLFAWGSSQQAREGGLYRIRYAGSGATMPIATKASAGSLAFTLSDPVDPSSIEDLRNYSFKVWDLKRSKNYGSPHINERELPIDQVRLSADHRTLHFEIAGLTPTKCYELKCRLRTAEGRSIERTIHGTIHSLPDSDAVN